MGMQTTPRTLGSSLKNYQVSEVLSDQ